jgi:hypothetical protein
MERTFTIMHEEKPGRRTPALDELRNLFITVVYIWVLLSVFALHRKIILRSYHISYSAKLGFAFVNALILAKFMWLGEVCAGKKAAGKVLLHWTLWNAALFTVILWSVTFWRKCWSRSGTATLSPRVSPQRLPTQRIA